MTGQVPEEFANGVVAWSLTESGPDGREAAIKRLTSMNSHAYDRQTAEAIVDAAITRVSKWSEEKKRRAAAEFTRPRPKIIANRDPGTVVTQARAALATLNEPPVLFRRGGMLSRVGRDDDGRAVIYPLSTPAIRAELATWIEWVKLNKKEGESPTGVPGIVVDDLSARADQLTAIPVIEQVVTAPVFAPDGTLITEPGFNAAARTWYEPIGGMKIPPVPQYPTRAQIEAAGKLLAKEYLGDFPFDTEASRQHALGAVLLPFARLMIDGPVPLQCADATTPGTGKGLLQRAQMYPALGGMLPALPGVLEDEEELRKKLTTSLMRGQQVIRWDNVTARVDSPVLSSVLTEPVWQDRILGGNRDAEIPVRSLFFMNGNNLSFSQEIARRAVPSRLDLARRDIAHAEQPWRRTQFRHDPLMGWAKQNRGILVHAALTLIQGWITAGRPAGSREIGSYESWARVIGGIVEHAAGPGASMFLTGLDDLYADAVSERDEKVVFLEEWIARLGNWPVTTRQVLDMCGDVEPFGVTGSGTQRGQQTRMGYWLGKMRDQVWGGYQVTKQGRMWVARKVQP
jgi:putative DNA primase/helicase